VVLPKSITLIALDLGTFLKYEFGDLDEICWEKKKCQGLTKPHWVNCFHYINIHLKYGPMSETNCTTYLVKHCITGDILV
jgi:hypothetical protein